MVNPPNKCKCAVMPYTDISWDTRKTNPWNFECRLADAYLGKSLQSDMAFYLESEDITIPAHSLIVSAASPVLEKLINGSGGIVTVNRVVNVPDCPEGEFMMLLRYVYTGIFNEEKLTIEVATNLLPLAHYFDLYHLEIICANHIEKNVRLENVCDTFDKIHFMDNSLTLKCIEIMQYHTADILADGSLMRMQITALNKVLALDKLALNCESDLFQPMLDWADVQCNNQGLVVTAVNRRDILKDRIYLIRFAAMTTDVFGKCIQMCGNDFFSAEEVAATMYSIVMDNDFKSTIDRKTFSRKRRTLHTLEIVNIYRIRSFGVNTFNQVPQTICLRDKTTLATLAGFETSNVVTHILNRSKTVAYSFVQKGKTVTFNCPIKFSDGACSITILTTKSLDLFVPATNSNSFARIIDSYAIFTSILIYKHHTSHQTKDDDNCIL